MKKILAGLAIMKLTDEKKIRFKPSKTNKKLNNCRRHVM